MPPHKPVDPATRTTGEETPVEGVPAAQFRPEATSMTKGKVLPPPKTRDLTPRLANVEHQMRDFSQAQEVRNEERYLDLATRLDACRDDVRHVERAILDLRRDEDDRHDETDKRIEALTTAVANATAAAQNAANAAMQAASSVSTLSGVVGDMQGAAALGFARLEERLEDTKTEVTKTTLRVDLHDKVLTKPQAAGLAVGGLSLGAILPVIIRAVFEALK